VESEYRKCVERSETVWVKVHLYLVFCLEVKLAFSKCFFMIY